MDATLKDLLWKFLTCLLVFSCLFFYCFSVSSDTRSSQLISSRLARANLISAHFMWEQTYCANSNAPIPLNFGKLHVCLTHNFTNLQFYGFTAIFANLPNLPIYDPKAARSDRTFTILPFFGAFFGNNGIYLFTVLLFYGAPGQKTCLSSAPCTQTPQSIFVST